MKAKKLAALVLAGALCMSALTGCGINANETAATLGEQEVTLGLTHFMCKYQKSSMDDMYVGYFGEKAWNQDLSGNGTTLGDSLKESVMDNLHDLYTVKAHMDDYKVSITEDEKKEIEKVAAAFIKDNSEDALKEMGATQELVEEMLTLYTIQWKMYEAIIVDTDRNVSDEDANMRAYSLVTIGTKGTTNGSGTFVNYTDAEKEKITEKINKMEAALKTGKLEDVAKEYDYKVTEGTYAKDNESLNKDLKKAMDALKEGEVSGAIKTDDATYFVRIDKETDKKATEENRKAIIEKRETELYNKVLEDWQKDDGWTVNEKAVDKIDFHNLFTQKDPNATEKESSKNTESKDTETKDTETKDTETESTETESADSTENK